MKLFVLSLSALLYTCIAFANLEDDFNALKDSGTNFEVIGVICEQVARLELYEREFPADKYEIHNGIAYGNSSRTIGELDVVVFEKATHKVALVGEVKCWKNMNSAHHKAVEQRQRFLANINSNAVLKFQSTTGDGTYTQDQFEGVKEFITIAQKGSDTAGFDLALDYSLDDLMGLRQRLMSCQQSHECAAPTH